MKLQAEADKTFCSKDTFWEGIARTARMNGLNTLYKPNGKYIHQYFQQEEIDFMLEYEKRKPTKSPNKWIWDHYIEECKRDNCVRSKEYRIYNEMLERDVTYYIYVFGHSMDSEVLFDRVKHKKEGNELREVKRTTLSKVWEEAEIRW